MINLLPKDRDVKGRFMKGRLSRFTPEICAKISKTKVGHFVSDETKLKISKSKIGCVSPNKGRKMSDEQRNKLSMALKGKRSWNKGLVGVMVAWNKGKSAWWAKGNKNVNWKGGITPLNHKIRTSSEYLEWRLKVLQRDYFKCIICGYRSRGKKTRDIVVDHIKPFSLYPELRFDISNGRTLCRKCDGVLGYNYNRDKVVYSTSF